MEYRIEIYDTWGRRIATYDETPLLDVARTTPDRPDWIRGMLPQGVTDLGHVYRMRVLIDGELFCDACVKRVEPHWGDSRKLILDRYVSFHEVIEIEAERPVRDGNTTVSWAYKCKWIHLIAKHAINYAPGPVHYLVAHEAYPDGAQREYQKFLGRKWDVTELEVGGISSGQWVGSNRIDASGAYAKDGDTVAGLVVDGEDWPDLRLMLIDCEETSRNSHAIARHPEVADWSDARYAASGYKLKADAAKAALQGLMDSKGIDYIELNPHKNAAGEFDDRVDVYGRYIGLIFGDGECFDAALVEQDHADVYLYEDGAYLVPEMQLKDFFSYAGAHEDSVEFTEEALIRFDASGGVFEILTALAYAAGGYVWSVGPDLAVRFRKAERPDRVFFFDPTEMVATLGSDSSGVTNIIHMDGNPLTGMLNKTYTRGTSVDEFGARGRHYDYFGLTFEQDGDKLAPGLLDDLAYPSPCGGVMFLRGNSTIRVGDIVELRDVPLRRLEREVSGEWGERFTGLLVGRVSQVTHRLMGKQVRTRVRFTSPLRSVENPLAFMVRSQPHEEVFYQFRLDDGFVGLDMGYHLD